MKKISLIFILIILLVVVFIILYPGKETTKIEFENVKVDVEVADTPGEREVGLMNREFLGENEGMLFVFNDDGRRTFWMKNTLIPLDMIFLDKNKIIVDIIENVTPCYEDPCELYPSGGMYVIEVNAGFAEKNNINVGDSVQLNL